MWEKQFKIYINKKYKTGLLKSRTQGSASYLEVFDDDAGVC